MGEPTALQKALHEQYFPQGTGGTGLSFKLEDVLEQLQMRERFGLSDEEHAEGLGVPVAYIRALRESLQK